MYVLFVDSWARETTKLCILRTGDNICPRACCLFVVRGSAVVAKQRVGAYWGCCKEELSSFAPAIQLALSDVKGDAAFSC